MPDDPARFTVAQRELFQRVANVILSNPLHFTQSGQWLDSLEAPDDVKERSERIRAGWLAEARTRRQVSKRSGRDAGRAHFVPMMSGTLSASRAMLARQIRGERADAARQLTRYEMVQAAARSILDDPPNYDALRPDLAQCQARRVLLVTWILTDARPLATEPSITELQGWEWGTAYLSDDSPRFTANENLELDAPCEINRLYARLTLLDDHLDEWEKLAGDALRIVDTTPQQMAPTNCTPTATGSRPKRGRLNKQESEAKRTAMLAMIRQHPSLKDDPEQLAENVGVSESTIRRWLADEEEKYKHSKAASPTQTTVKCEHCGDSIAGNETCPECARVLIAECIDCHRENVHGEITGAG
jgi:hypothetical protein